MYLEKIEDSDDILIYLRPGRFGKTLFTSMMYYYYDINSIGLFDTLFKDTYVYKHPTIKKNSYYILKFDFSGMSSETKYSYEDKFKECIISGIENFKSHYNIEYTINEDKDVSSICKRFLSYIYSLNLDNKLYVIIDEYDNFTNAVLEGETKLFREAVGKNGYVKDFYTGLKEQIGTTGVVDRIFVTGVCPITLNAMTSGFNIATNISTNLEFNVMTGLTHEEVKTLINDICNKDTDEIYKVMVDNYDGYLFNERNTEKAFNPTLVMYFLREYLKFKEIPKDLVDRNITSNFTKIKDIIILQDNKYYKDILDEILKNNKITGKLQKEYNLDLELSEDDIISLLYYFGYLTIDNSLEYTFRISNYVMREVYSNYFLYLLKVTTNIDIDFSTILPFEKELINKGSITGVTNQVVNILKKGGDRVLNKYDEKYIQVVYQTLLDISDKFDVYLEYPCSNGYIDLMVFSRNNLYKYNVLVELKYIKKKIIQKSY